MKPVPILLAWLASLAAGCAPSEGTIHVQLQTDYEPSIEFTHVRTELSLRPLEEGGSTIVQPHEVAATDDFREGLPVAEYQLPSGAFAYLRVSLLARSGRLVGQRLASAEVEEDRVLHVGISRACEGVRCPRAGDDPAATTCLSGRCVTPACLPEDPDSCPADALCEGDGDCEPGLACQRGLCGSGGGCLTPSTCGSGQVCGAAGECVAAPRCGDGECQRDSESPCSCGSDCGDTPCPATCDDGVCAAEESALDCPEDCPVTCGDGACVEGVEGATDCPDDCAAEACGDTICGPAETHASCPRDCAEGCGDSECGPAETHASCPPDCVEGCGDSECDPAETHASCPGDCAEGCGDSECGAAESPQLCPGDCAICGDTHCAEDESCERCPECCSQPPCGDRICVAPESCESCRADCPAGCVECGDGICHQGDCAPDCDGPTCGDGSCDAGEGCECQQDCGWVGCGGFPQLPYDPSCTGRGSHGGEVCAGLTHAFTARSVNIAYYPMRTLRETALISGDTWGSGAGVSITLGSDVRFAVQSTRNPECLDFPPLRPARRGDGELWMFGYAVEGVGVDSRVGWVRAADLRLDPSNPTQSCVTGPTGSDFQVRLNPYSRPMSCAPIECDQPLQLCSSANPSGEGVSDCDGREVDEVRFVDAQTLILAYSPDGPPRRLLHRDDQVRVRFRTAESAFVIAQRTSTPDLTPAGTRGWVNPEFLRE